MTVIRSVIRSVKFSPIRQPTTLYKGGGDAAFRAALATLDGQGFSLPLGLMSTFNNATQQTFQVTAELPVPSFTRVKVILAVGQGSPAANVGGLSVAVAASATDLNGASETHVQGLFGGSATGVIPTPPNATFRRSFLISDWIDIASVARSDGGTWPLIIARAYMSDSATIGVCGSTSYDFTNWATRSTGRRWAMRRNAGNCCQGTGTPANFVSTTNQRQCAIAGFVYETADGKVLTVAHTGDSITEGAGTYRGEGFRIPALDDLAEQYPGYYFGDANIAWYGSGMDSMHERIGDLLMAGLSPDLVIFPTGSPNISAPINETKINAARTNAKLAIDIARGYGVPPGMWTWLPSDPSGADWGASDLLRQAYNAEQLARTDLPVGDFAATVSGTADVDGQIPLLNSTDGTHPSDAGNAILAVADKALIKRTLTQELDYGYILKRGASVELDFLNNLATVYGEAVALSSLITATDGVSSNGTAYGLDSNGAAVAFAASTMRRTDLGVSVQAAATTLTPRSRRLDDAAVWTLTSMTASAAEGLDGVAGSCTRLTATGANATCIGPANTSASAARRFSPWIRRVSGTGAIELTVDGGSTWSAISAPTGVLVRYPYGATVANPQVGIRIVDSGDVIDVDFANGESNTIDTDPIESGAANATRVAGVLQVLSPAVGYIATARSTYLEMDDCVGAANARIIDYTPRTTQSAVWLSTTSIRWQNNAGVALDATLGSGDAGGVTKLCLDAFYSGMAVVANGGTRLENTNSLQGITAVYLGNNPAGTAPMNGKFRKAVWGYAYGAFSADTA